MRWFLKFFWLAAVPLSVAAQDVTLTAGDADKRLTRELQILSLSLSLENSDDPKPQDYVAAARADYQRLLTALYAEGYYGGTISIQIDGREAAGMAPLDAPRNIARIEISVEPGPQFVFGRAIVAPLPEGATLPERFVSDAPARSNIIREGVSNGIDAWRNAGHAKAQLADQQITARHLAGELDATVRLSPGPQLTFGALTVSGNQAVRESAIRRIAGLPEGVVYSPKELADAQRRLRRTGAFDSVAMTEADDFNPDKSLPISLQILESKPRRFGFGLELSSIEGLLVSSYWMHRNAFGGAERLRVEGEIAGIGGETGGVDYRLSTSLGIPAIYGPDTDLLATATIERQDEPDYLIDRISLEAMATRRLTDDLSANLGVGLLSARERRDGFVREYTLLMLPVGLELEGRDNPTNAKNGYYLDVDATPFVSIKGGDDGGRVYADARAYRSFGADDRFTFAARAQIGSLFGATATTAPADFLFYSGGGGTVRGQRYKSLGGDFLSDVQLGGLSFAGAQLEARVGVSEKIAVVGFYDYGYVGTSETPLKDGDWHAGTGIGVRYDTGIGPIRLDIGTPANGDDAFGSVQVYIGIGQAF